MAAPDLTTSDAAEARSAQPAPAAPVVTSATVEAPTGVWEMARRYWVVGRPARRVAIASVVLSSVAGVFEGTALMMLVPLLQPTGSGAKVPGLFSPLLEGLGFHGRALVWASVAGFGLMSLCAAVGTFAGAVALLRARAQLEAHLRKDMTDRLLGMEWSAFLMTRFSDIATSVVVEGSQVGAGVQQVYSSVTAFLVAMFFVAYAFLLSPELTGLVIGVALVAVVLLRPLSRRAEAHTRRLTAATQEIVRRIADVLGNLKFFRSTGSCARAQVLFSADYDEFALRFEQTQRMPYAVRLGYQLGALFFVVILISFSLRGAATLSATTLVFLAIFLRLSPRLNVLQGGLVMARVQYPWVTKWDEHIATVAANQARPSGTGAPTFAEQLVADRVSFAFTGDTPRVLDGVSWELRRGDVVAFVGESGAGKTTLLDLVTGLLVPTEGRICLDGTPLTDLDTELWQSHIGLVLDQNPLFHGTVRENVVGDAEPDDGFVWECLRAAHAETFVRELPGQLDTKIGERGARLSGGQRQRVGLARALYRRPWLLILDEATSALDAVSEGVVLDALKGLHGQVSMLIVAHRLATVQMADRIHVLDQGRIVQSGSWDELLADRDGPFARMAAKQGIFAAQPTVMSG